MQDKSNIHIVDASVAQAEAVARLMARCDHAIEILAKPGNRTREEIVEAATVLVTYGDVVWCSRAIMVMQALNAAPDGKVFAGRPRAEPEHAPRGLWSLENILMALVVVIGIYIAVGVTVAIVHKVFGA